MKGFDKPYPGADADGAARGTARALVGVWRDQTVMPLRRRDDALELDCVYGTGADRIRFATAYWLVHLDIMTRAGKEKQLRRRKQLVKRSRDVLVQVRVVVTEDDPHGSPEVSQFQEPFRAIPNR